MYNCPFCNQLGITALQKLHSVFFNPAICKLCHRPSYLHLKHAIQALFTWAMLTWVFIGVALYEGMTVYLIGTVPALFLAIDKHMLTAPLQTL